MSSHKDGRKLSWKDQPGKQPLRPVYKPRRSIPGAPFIVRKGSQSEALTELFSCLLLKVLSCLHFLPRGVGKVLQVSQPPEPVPFPPSELFSGVALRALLGVESLGNAAQSQPSPGLHHLHLRDKRNGALCSGQLSFKGLVLLGPIRETETTLGISTEMVLLRRLVQRKQTIVS